MHKECKDTQVLATKMTKEMKEKEINLRFSRPVPLCSKQTTCDSSLRRNDTVYKPLLGQTWDTVQIGDLSKL